jgi:2,3-bisphosphoglycerate-dependent phosphoglycerate mutase
MAALALIRYGEYQQLENTPSALQPFPLTSKGAEEVRNQARRFGKWLSDSGHLLETDIHCSSLLRAWQTAEIFREELEPFFVAEAQTRSFPALCERSVGALANLSVSEIERIVDMDPRLAPLPKGWKSNSDFKLPFDGAESLLEAGERVACHLRSLPVFEPSQRIQIVVGHGASIRHASYYLDVIPFSDIRRLSMFYGHPVVFQRVNQHWTRIYGNWKHRENAGPID